jgi:hypothetical protein
VTALAAPQDLAAEEATLGALLLAGSHGVETAERVLARIAETGLRAGDFYRESHTKLYLAIVLDRAPEVTDRVRGRLYGTWSEPELARRPSLISASTSP